MKANDKTAQYEDTLEKTLKSAIEQASNNMKVYSFELKEAKKEGNKKLQLALLNAFEQAEKDHHLAQQEYRERITLAR